MGPGGERSTALFRHLCHFLQKQVRNAFGHGSAAATTTFSTLLLLLATIDGTPGRMKPVAAAPDIIICGSITMAGGGGNGTRRDTLAAFDLLFLFAFGCCGSGVLLLPVTEMAHAHTATVIGGRSGGMRYSHTADMAHAHTLGLSLLLFLLLFLGKFGGGRLGKQVRVRDRRTRIIIIVLSVPQMTTAHTTTARMDGWCGRHLFAVRNMADMAHAPAFGMSHNTLGFDFLLLVGLVARWWCGTAVFLVNAFH